MLDVNGPESIHRAVTLAQLFSTTNALSPQQGARIAILVEEAVTNLYDHCAVQAGFSGTLTLAWAPGPTPASNGGDIYVTLCDSGAPFDPRAAEPIDRPNMDRGGGAGLAIIRAWAEIIDYRSEGGVNRLELKLRN